VLRRGTMRRIVSMLWLVFAVRAPSLREITGLVTVATSLVATCRALASVLSGFGRRERAQPRPPSWRREVVVSVSTPSRRQRGCDNLCSVCAEARLAESLRAVRNHRLRLVFRRDTRATRGRVTRESGSSRVELRRWLLSGRLVRSRNADGDRRGSGLRLNVRAV